MQLSQNTVLLTERSTEVQKRVRVLLVDGSIIVLHGLKSFLSENDHITVVGTARTEGEAFAVLRTCQAHVVIMAVRVGRTSGIDMCRIIRESYPKIAVLFFTTNDDKRVLQSAILAGAHGYLLKTASREAMVTSIELVAAGKAILDPQVTHHVITWVRDEKWDAPHKTLQECSMADQKILSLVATGKTNKEIAQELQVDLSVITARLQRLYKRLRITRRTEAASHFVRLAKGPFKHLDWQ